MWPAFFLGELVFVAVWRVSWGLLNCPVVPDKGPYPLIKFFLYTIPGDPPFILTEENARLAPITSKTPLATVIHGLKGNYNSRSNVLLKGAFQKAGYIVLVPDYGAYAKPLCYLAAVKSTCTLGRIVGRVLAALLAAEKLDADRLRIVGFSLGAQVAGAAASWVKQRIGLTLPRVTGLDPAGPFYTWATEDCSINPSVAKFVEAIHSTLFPGIGHPVGHLDIFLNNGPFQPGCGSINVIDRLSCSHDRAVQCYAESINSDVGFYAAPCEFKKLSCSYLKNPIPGLLIKLDLNTPEVARGTWRIDTNSIVPFAKGSP